MTNPILPADGKPKRKEKPKGLPQRRWLVVMMILIVLFIGVTLLIVMRAAPAATPYVTNYEVRPYPTFTAPYQSSTSLVGVDEGFLAVTANGQMLTKRQFIVNNTEKSTHVTCSIPLQAGVVASAIGSNGGAVWADYAGTTAFASGCGDTTTIAVGAPTIVSLSGDGSRLAFTNSMGQGAIYDTATLQKTADIPIETGEYGSASSLVFNHNGTRLVVLSPITGYVYDLSSDMPTLLTQFNATWDAKAVFTSDNTLLVVSSENLTIILPDQTLKSLMVTPGSYYSTMVALSPDNTTLAGILGNTLYTWSVELLLNAQPETLAAPNGTMMPALEFPVNAMAFSTDSRTLALMVGDSAGSTLQLYNAQTFELISTISQ